MCFGTPFFLTLVKDEEKVDTLKAIGKRIKILRERKKLTQEELAEKSHSTAQYISALERGQKNATVKILEKVADGLDVEVLSLFAFDSSTDQPSKLSLKKLIDQVSDEEVKKVFRIIRTVLDT
jgi:transcriptional regulator with XRE-family HTH domain